MEFNAKKMYVLKIERIQNIVIKMVLDLEYLTFQERLKEIHLTSRKKRKR